MCFLCPKFSLAQSLLVENLSGPITPNEIQAFKTYMNAKVNPDPNKNDGNIWVYGNNGKAIEACGLMYEATGDIDILNRMIHYCDMASVGRNDLKSESEGGQKIVWTGNIEPVWPSDVTEVPARAGVEQGQVLSHMVYCSLLILQNPGIWNLSIPNQQGALAQTYKQRALKYIQESNYVMDNWILPRFIRTNDRNRYYFPGAPNTYKPNDPAPWNQAFMLTNAFVRLTQCHLILNDDPSRITLYDDIVKPNLEWFFSETQPRKSKEGNNVKLFLYAIGGSVEDANHLAYDVEGLYIAYKTGRYGIKFEDLVPFANTYIDMVLGIPQPNGTYAGRIDGTVGSGNSGGDNYVRDEYFYLPTFRPDQFTRMANINISAGRIASYPQGTARLLWQKQQRYLGSLPNQSNLPEQAYGLLPGDKSVAVSLNVDLKWTGSTNTKSYKVFFGSNKGNLQEQGEVTDYTFRIENLDELTTYFWRIDAINEQGTITGEINEFKTLSLNITVPDPNSSYRITGNGGIITAQYEGTVNDTKNENYPNLIDLNTNTKYFIAQKKLWVQYQSLTPEILSFYEIASANDTPTRDPKDWILYGSNDGITWDILDQQTDQVFSERFEKKYFVVDATTAYKYYKLDITANSGASQIQFSEWNLYRVNTTAIIMSSFKAHSADYGIDLEWKANNIKENTSFQVLRRDNTDNSFQILGEIKETNVDYYTFRDRLPVIGVNYYLIRQVNPDNHISDSDIVAVDYFTNSKLSLYVKEGILYFMSNALLVENISISLFNIDGRKLLVKHFSHPTVGSEVPLEITLKPGVYISQINTDSEVISNKIIVH